MALVNIAFLILEIANLSGSGGAERFSADFFNLYNQSVRNRKLFFLTDDYSNLVEAGRFKDGPLVRRVPFFLRKIKKLAGSRFRPWVDWMDWWAAAIDIIFFCRKNKISILHLPLYTDRYYILLSRILRLSTMIHPLKFAISMVDSRMPHHYFSELPEHVSMSRRTYGRLFESFPLDGILTYYDSCERLFREQPVLSGNPVVKVVKTRFTLMPFRDNRTVKQKLVVWAGRLDEFKRPLFFLEALARMKDIGNPAGWRFEMFGRGYLYDPVMEFIRANNLTGLVSLRHVPDMSDVFESSCCFVSTQDYENFPSHSMAEAMAKGNAIIARKVGNTALYVHHNKNGLILEEDTPVALAQALMEVLSDQDRLNRMGAESINILHTFHHPEKFVREMEIFWEQVETADQIVLSDSPRPLGFNGNA